MIIRKYGDIPATYAPDVGEVVMARKTLAYPFIRAAVLGVRRKHKSGNLEIKVQWLASNPPEVDGDKPIIEGDQGWIVAAAWPPMIKQITKGDASSG